MKRAAFPLALCCACTTLGPMPATTGISAVPIGRPGVEAQFGSVPGFYASQSARNEVKAQNINGATAMIDLDRWLPVKGLLVGGRVFGKENDTPLEPFVGYRRRLVEAVSLGGVVFGSSNRGGSATMEPGATYHGVRFGGEAMVDVELWEPSPWVRITAQGAVSATRTLASGTYCVDAEGVGIDCNEDTTLNRVIAGKFVGVYPAGTVGLAVDVGKHQGLFNSVRLALIGTAGQMPLVLAGQENGTGSYFQLGITLGMSFGIGRGDDDKPQE